MIFILDKNNLIVKNILGETIPFDVTIYTKKSNKEDFENETELKNENIYLHINQYFQYINLTNQNLLYVTFDIYKQIRDIFDDYTLVLDDIIYQIKPLISQLLSIHKLPVIRNWIEFESNIQIPSKIEDKFIPNELIPNNREKTYTKSDYKALLSFSLQLRLMIPIWGEFIKYIKKDELNSKKEMKALSLIENADCYNYVFSDSDEGKTVIDKLLSYINSNIKEDKLSMSVLISKNIPTIDYIDYLLSKIIVTRIIIGEISTTNDDLNLISLIFNYLTSLLDADNRNEQVLPKNFDSENGSDDVSRLESYKVRQKLSIGDTELNKFFLTIIDLVAKKLSDNMNFCFKDNKRILDVFMHNVHNHLELKKIEDVQLTITSWVLATTKKNENKILISPRIMPYLEKKVLLNAIAIAATWMWINDNKILSLAITGCNYNKENGDINYLSGGSSRERLNPEYESILNEYYKYSIIRGKNKNNKNQAILTIEKIEKDLSKNLWELPSFTEDNYILTQANIDWRNPILSIPTNIKNLLAKLIIDLNKFSNKI